LKKIKLKPFSRLTIIFVLAVTIPGSILTYLSIQNITNLKELTEKKVLEEQKNLADLVYQNFQNKLKDISREFADCILKIEESDYTSIRFSDTIEFIDNPFIIDQNGKILWPEFIADIAYKKEETYSAKFVWSFNAAEKYEFIEQNYPRSKSLYLKSLSNASGKSDSAQSINAIARLNVKNSNYEEALKYYFILTSKLYSILEVNVYPPEGSSSTSRNFSPVLQSISIKKPIPGSPVPISRFTNPNSLVIASCVSEKIKVPLALPCNMLNRKVTF